MPTMHPVRTLTPTPSAPLAGGLYAFPHASDPSDSPDRLALMPNPPRAIAAHRPWPRRPARGPHAAKVLRRRFNGPCYVYLLVHQHDRRFKIGLSQDPVLRAHNLREAPCVDWGSSVQVALPNPGRAAQVERMLHKALAGFRLDFRPMHAQAWDGSTEWFDQSGFRHAINLLRVTPTGGERSDLARLRPLDQPSSEESSGSGQVQTEARHHEAQAALTLAEVRQQQAAQYNLQQIAVIAEVLTVLSWELRIEVQDKQDLPHASPTIVCIHGLRHDWSEAMMKARFEVVDSELWALQTGHADPARRVWPLVRLIRYSSTAPDSLELVVNDLKAIGRLPGGVKVVAQWKALCQRLT